MFRGSWLRVGSRAAGTKALRQRPAFMSKKLYQLGGQGGEGFLYAANQSLASVHLRVSQTLLKIL